MKEVDMVTKRIIENKVKKIVHEKMMSFIDDYSKINKKIEKDLVGVTRVQTKFIEDDESFKYVCSRLKGETAHKILKKHNALTRELIKNINK